MRVCASLAMRTPFTGVLRVSPREGVMVNRMHTSCRDLKKLQHEDTKTRRKAIGASNRGSPIVGRGNADERPATNQLRRAYGLQSKQGVQGLRLTRRWSRVAGYAMQSAKAMSV